MRNEDEYVNGSFTGQKQSVWESSVFLNDAAFMGYMDWPDFSSNSSWDSNDLLSHFSEIPGRLAIDGINSDAGAFEAL